MRLVCISASQIPSNTANSIQAMKACQAIAQLGHQAHLLIPGRVAHPWERLATHYGLETPFQVEWLPANRRMRRYDFALAAVRRARNLGAQAVYVWPLQAAVLALVQGLPALLELHGQPEGIFGPSLFRLFLASGQRKRLLPITQALVHSLQARFRMRLDADQLVLAPNGVDLERYQELPTPRQARLQLGLPEGVTIGYTGHLYPGRGVDLMQSLAMRHPGVNFLWVGGRPADVRTWQDRLARAEVANVSLVGFVENHRLPLYQAAADILLMPYETVIAGSGGGDSAGYASPMKMFEYLASERAILSSDLPVIREVLDEAVAVLVPPGDIEAWDQALISLIKRPDRRLELGQRARQRAAQYTWQARAQNCLDGFAP